MILQHGSSRFSLISSDSTSIGVCVLVPVSKVQKGAPLVRVYLINASKEGLEQAAHTFGLIRSLNLTGASVDITVDCLVMGAFRSST